MRLRKLFYFSILFFIAHQLYSQNILRINDKRKIKNVSEHNKKENSNSNYAYPEITGKNWIESGKTINHVRNEILISYQNETNAEIRGHDILDEHSNLIALISKQIDVEIISYKPVSEYLVKKMVVENKTEPEIQNEAHSLRNNLLKKVGGFSNAINYNSSRILSLKVKATNDDELFSIIEKIKNTKQQLQGSGIILNVVEPNYLAYVSTSMNDPYIHNQWSYNNTGAELGWDVEQGSKNIKVGIIDCGIDMKHPDLIDNIDSSLGYDFVDIDTAAYTSVGYILIHDEDYINLDNDPSDYNGHGTHCAGIVGAKGNNGIGICGVAPNISLVPLRAGFSILNPLNQEVGTLEYKDIVAAIDYAILKGIDILSMSFGGTDNSELLATAISNASNNNIILVAAAGNNLSQIKSYPAGYDEVISVAASDYYDNQASFSNYGFWVTVCAPGVNIFSTVPTTGGMCHDASGYRYLSGTSMATPFVAGLVGLMLSKNPNLSPNAVKYILQNTSDVPNEKVHFIGSGRVNIYKALLENITQIPLLKTEITNITDDQIIKSSYDIIGTASGESYKIFIGIGAYPSNWAVIDSGTTVTNGYLGKMNFSTIPTGEYQLKLTAYKNNIISESRVYIRITIDEKQKYGFPIKVPITNTTGVSGHGYIVSDDLYNDGKKELIVTSLYEQYLHIYNYQGKELSGWPVRLPEDGWVEAKPCVCDINKDGNDEIIILAHPGFNSTNFLNSIICVYDIKGNMLPGWPKYFQENMTNIFYIIAEDIDGDGDYEIIVPSQYNDVSQIIAFKKTGDIMPGWPYAYESGYHSHCNPVVADIDGDNKKEVVINAFHYLDPNNYKHYLIAIDCNGKKKVNFNYALKSWGWPLAGADINIDGKIEIMTQNGMIDGNANSLQWNKLQTNVYSRIAFGDVHLNSDLEVLWGDGDGKAYLTDNTGNVLNGWPIRKGDFTADGDNIIADINGDGQPDIIILWEANTPASLGLKPGINAYDINGKMLDGFPKYEGIYYFDQVVVDDIDDDGNVEMICYSTNDHEIIALDLGNKFNPQCQDWSTPLHDNRNTNNYNTPKPNPILYKLQDVVMNEDEQKSLRFSPSSLNWDMYNVKVTSDRPAVETIYSNGNLNLIPSMNWNGKAKIYLLIQGGQRRDSSSFKLTVLPVNDPPAAFKLLTPSDTTSIVINNLTVNDSLSFSWEKSLNIDSDTIFYKINFDVPLQMLNRDKLLSTKIKYPIKEISDLLTSLNISNVDVQWGVSSTDNKDTVTATNNKYTLRFKREINTSVINSSNEIPAKIFLTQNFPNPFNPTAKINFGLNKENYVSIMVYNILGQVVATLVDDQLKAGYHYVLFNGNNFASGLYFYKMKTAEFVQTKKMILMR
jgi:thermitase